jgi:hypothetical protein
MIPAKEKAKELVDEYKYLYDDDGKLYLHASLNIAKRYAIIAVNLLITETRAKYWYDVKKEIELL